MATFTITTKTEKLTDGSKVFNVMLRSEFGEEMKFSAYGKKDADKLADALAMAIETNTVDSAEVR